LQNAIESFFYPSEGRGGKRKSLASWDKRASRELNGYTYLLLTGRGKKERRKGGGKREGSSHRRADAFVAPDDRSDIRGKRKEGERGAKASEIILP